MRSLRRLRDPAPSRSAYRLHRLMLTPTFRLFLRVGLPFAVMFAATTAYLSDPARRDGLIESAVDMRRQIEQRPEFMVNLMAIDGASDAISEEVREAVPIDFPMSSFDLDLEVVRAKIETIDAVAAASIKIKSGGVLQVDITERVPAVVWRARGGLELLDREGHRVSDIDARAMRPDLPLLAGEGADKAVEEALQILETAALLNARLRGLLRVGERRWDVVLDRDQRILLPEDNPVPALERVIGLNEIQRLLERDVLVVDVRNPERATIRMSSDAAANFRDTALYEIGASSQ